MELETMGNLSVISFLLFKVKIMVKQSLIKIKPQSSMENNVDTNGAPVFAPDYSATVSADKMLAD